MSKKIAAIIAAAACAGPLVVFAPGLTPEVEARAPQATDYIVPSVVTVGNTLEQARPAAADIRKAVEQNLRKGSRAPKIVCAQSWPYYEQTCLRDDREGNGNARVVRVIAAERSAASQTIQARR